MIKWIIFYVSLTGASHEEPPMGDILFFKGDSLKAFDMIWKIKSQEAITEYGDKLYYGIFQIEHTSIKASVSIIDHEVIFKIEGVENILMTMQQRPHYSYLYEDIEEDYEVIKKRIDRENLRLKKKRREKIDGQRRIQ
jgi:hypothetical protein